MLSGETANTDTPFLPSNDMSKKDASIIPGDRDDESEDPLKPDPGSEATFQVDDNSFAFSPGQLGKLFNPKSHRAFLALGGLAGLQKGLRTNVQSGLSVDEGALAGTVSFEKATAAPHEDDQEAHKTADGSRSSSDLGVPKDAAATYVDRKRVFGTNVLPTKSAKSIWRLMWEQYNDKILILLTIAAVISLALGLYETFGTEAHIDENTGKEEPKVNWIEGVAICVAILIVVLVGSLNDWQKERQFVKLNAKVCTDPPQFCSDTTKSPFRIHY